MWLPMAVVSTHAILIIADISQKEVIQVVILASRKTHGIGGKYHAINNTNHPGSAYKALAKLGVHYGHIVQRPADSAEPVIRHHSQKDIFNWAENHISENLESTATKVYPLASCPRYWPTFEGLCLWYNRDPKGQTSKEVVLGSLDGHWEKIARWWPYFQSGQWCRRKYHPKIIISSEAGLWIQGIAVIDHSFSFLNSNSESRIINIVEIIWVYSETSLSDSNQDYMNDIDNSFIIKHINVFLQWYK